MTSIVQDADHRHRRAGRRWLVGAALAVLACPLVVAGCGTHGTAPRMLPARSYRMGFAAGAPRFDFALLLAALEQWTSRADVAIIGGEAPWDSLLAGTPAADYVRRQHLPLAQYYRGKGLHVWVYIDPANGLDRAGESSALVAAGRSITEPAIQQLYREYAVACDTLLHPDVFGVALETNLIRLASPPTLYAAVRQVANDAAADIRAADASVQLSSSVQVEAAWGRLGLGTGYQGVETDFADFPYIQVLGLSSYPYFAWTSPDSLPADYYSRLVAGHAVRVGISEGGWTSQSFAGIVSSPALQQLYIERQAQLLDGVNAVAWFQLTYTDLEIGAFPPAQAAGLAPFAHLGLVDTVLAAKPARTAWDATFARPLR
jgi:hypothetical protein